MNGIKPGMYAFNAFRADPIQSSVKFWSVLWQNAATLPMYAKLPDFMSKSSMLNKSLTEN
jgi:hypothetical protein